jgi:hypothetical protein
MCRTMSLSNSSVSSRVQRLPVQVPGQVGADVFLGGHGVVVLFDLQFVGVDGDVAAGEVFQPAAVMEVQMAHDHGADVADAISSCRQRVIQLVPVVVDIAGKRIPGGFRPVLSGVLRAAGIEEDRSGLRVLDDRGDNRHPAALEGRMRVGLDCGGGAADEEPVIDIQAAQIEQ